MSSSLRFAFNLSLLTVIGVLCACTNNKVIVGEFEDAGSDATSNPDAHEEIDSGPNADLGTEAGPDAGSDAGEVSCMSAWRITINGECDAQIGYAWNGSVCQAVSGCSCEGPECDAVVRSSDVYECYDELRAQGCELYDIMVVDQSGDLTSEAGASVYFALELTRRPSADVVVSMQTSNSGEGVVTPSTGAFTTSNSKLRFTVTGVDDAIADGDQVYFVAPSPTVSADPLFDGLGVPHLALTNRDDDGVCINVAAADEIALIEGGEAYAISVSLCDAPTESIVVTASSDDPSEGVVSPTALTFTTANWSTPQVVTLSPVDDSLADGAIDFHLRFSTHSSPSPDDVIKTVTTYDDDTAGVIVDDGDGLITTENGGTAVFTVVLTQVPTANVTISFASSDTSEGTVSPSSLTFSGASALTPQTVTVTGVDDDVFDADVLFTIVTGAASSTDLSYNGLDVPDLSVTNQYVPIYVKAGTTRERDAFGSAMAISSDGNTLVVGAPAVYSFTPDPLVYVYSRSGGVWSPTPVVLRGSNTERGDNFGASLAISADGNTIVVGAQMESSNALGIGGNEADNSAYGAGAAYVFTRSGSSWTQQAYLKASNTGEGDHFGRQVAVSASGDTVAISASSEQSAATGVGGNQADDSLLAAGAVYVFTRASSTWTQQAYVKASNPDDYDEFGAGLALSADGNTMAVGATSEASSAIGINGDQNNDDSVRSGAVYVFARTASVWTQQAYVKASVPAPTEYEAFGVSIALSPSGNDMVVIASSAAYSFARSSGVWTQNARIENMRGGEPTDVRFRTVAMSDDANTLLIGMPTDPSSARRIDGDESDRSWPATGGVYRFVRSGGTWSRANYLKAPNADPSDAFGSAVAMPADASFFIVSAINESSAASGINGDSSNNSLIYAGAVYIFR